MPKRVVLYANDENVGDYLSAQGIVELLGGVDHALGFEYHRPLIARTLRSLGPDDLVVVGGGGLLKNTFDSFWRFFLGLAQERGFRYALWGVGYCDVKGQQTRGDQQLLRGVVAGAVAAGLRDPMSLEPFGDLAQAELVPCPAIPYVRSRTKQPSGTHILSVEHPGLISALQGLGQRDVGAGIRQSTSSLAARTGEAVVSIDNLMPVSQFLPTRAAARLAPTRRARRRTAARARELLDLYAGARLVVTTRLHGAILGLASNTPVVAMSGDRKIDEFFELLGLSRWVAGSTTDLERLLATVDGYELPVGRLEWVATANTEFCRRLRTAHSGS